jgi:hypothetical protein
MKGPSHKPGKDVINELIEDALLAFPVSSLLISLYQAYQRRGFLTKKQLQALHKKASTVAGIQPGRLATLEAIIRKMPNRYKSALPESEPPQEKDEEVGKLLQIILGKYPQHKRVLYLNTKYGQDSLSPEEVNELKRFQRLLKL